MLLHLLTRVPPVGPRERLVRMLLSRSWWGLLTSRALPLKVGGGLRRRSNLKKMRKVTTRVVRRRLAQCEE